MSASKTIRMTLRVWRQANAATTGRFETYQLNDVSPEMSFLEMLDVLNEKLLDEKKEPIAFDHDCREGICGTCGFMVDGIAHGPDAGTTLCQLHMRRFSDGDTLTLEPWRATGFPIVKDLVVDRSAFDKIIQAGGYVSIRTGSAPDGNAIPISKDVADKAMDAAACIGCGACVAACPNASAMLFTAAKVSQLSLLPQGAPERSRRAKKMVSAMSEDFGSCTNHKECEAACPKEISFGFINRLNQELVRANTIGSNS